MKKEKLMFREGDIIQHRESGSLMRVLNTECMPEVGFGYNLSPLVETSTSVGIFLTLDKQEEYDLVTKRYAIHTLIKKNQREIERLEKENEELTEMLFNL